MLAGLGMIDYVTARAGTSPASAMPPGTLGAMGRRADPDRVLAAQLTGIAAGLGQVKRCTRDEALAEIAETLGKGGVKTGSERAQRILDDAAAMFVKPSGPGDDRWYSQAAALLAEAGADLERAVAIQHARQGGGFTTR